MGTRAKLILLCLVGLLAAGAVAATLASAEEEVEAPYWKVGGARLETKETASLKLALKPGTKATWRAVIDGKNIEEVCSVAVSEEAMWRGSENHHDGKMFTVIHFENCVLYVENIKKEFEEVPGCKDEPFTITVEGKLWYEGSKEAHKETIVALLKSAEKSIGTQKITKVEGKTCLFVGTYSIEGSVAALVTPDNKEAKTGEVVFPKTSISEVWQPQEGGTAEKPALAFEKSKATFEAEFTTELTSGKEFGAFSK